MNKGLCNLNPEQFEELCKDLLILDGFKNVQVHAKGPDEGIDLTAIKNVPIAHAREYPLAWSIQCKHTITRKALGRDYINKILYDFDTQGHNQGLIIITNTKLSAPATKRINEYIAERNRLVLIYDITDIKSLLSKHPFLLDKYGIFRSDQILPGASTVRTLILSDGSVFAYHVYSLLRKTGFQVRETRLHNYGSNVLSVAPSEIEDHFDLAIVFLAELYWCPIPEMVLDGLYESISRGLRVIFTPFCAWSVGTGLNPLLESMLPVHVKKSNIDLQSLIMQDPAKDILDINLNIPPYEDTFIENQMINFHIDSGGLFSSEYDFSGRATYEFLELAPDAQVLSKNTDDNILIAARTLMGGKTAYLNMCAHNCMTPFPLTSPLENRSDLGRLIAEFALSFGKRKINAGNRFMTD